MKIEEINIEILEQFSNSVFVSKKWLEIFSKSIKAYAIYNKNNDIIGGFILYLEKTKFGVAIKNPPFTPNISLFYENKSSNNAKLLSENKKINKLIAEFIDTKKALITTISLPPYIIDTQSFFWNKYKVNPNYTYLIDLSKDIDVIHSNFSPERRNDIKKAKKDNIEILICSDYNVVKSLILNTFNRKNKSVNTEMIDKILFSFSNNNNSFAFVSYKDKKPIAASFCVYDSDKAYYLLGGYDSENKHQGAGALALSSAINHAKELGIKEFDLEGSMLPEIEKYFRGYGGKITPYYSLNKASCLMEVYMKCKGSINF